MKKLSKIRLKEHSVLDSNAMKHVVGANGGYWCNVGGEWVGPLTSCSDDYCASLYGSGSTCQKG